MGENVSHSSCIKKGENLSDSAYKKQPLAKVQSVLGGIQRIRR